MNLVKMIINILEKSFGFLKLFIYRIINYNSLKVKGFPKIRINTKLKIENNGLMSVSNFSCFDNCLIIANGGKLTIGARVFFNRNVIVVCQNLINIYDDCVFGPNVMIYDHDHKYDKNGIVKNEYKLGSIVIEKGCWIGAGCIILRNTHIGEGSVIGAGCVVKGNIPPHSLVTSNRELNIVPINK
jgi:acetyltransferase-like isoleucine patch superfamily enzyme